MLHVLVLKTFNDSWNNWTHSWNNWCLHTLFLVADHVFVLKNISWNSQCLHTALLVVLQVFVLKTFMEQLVFTYSASGSASLVHVFVLKTFMEQLVFTYIVSCSASCICSENIYGTIGVYIQWCLLGVFLFASIHPSRTQMSGPFVSVSWNACVHRLGLGLHSHPKQFLGNGVQTHINSKGKIPSTGKNLLRGGWNPQHCIKQDSEPNTLPTSYWRPASQSRKG